MSTKARPQLVGLAAVLAVTAFITIKQEQAPVELVQVPAPQQTHVQVTPGEQVTPPLPQNTAARYTAPVTDHSSGREQTELEQAELEAAEPPCPACPAPSPPPPTGPSSGAVASNNWGHWDPLPAVPPGGSNAEFATRRANLRQCINEKPVDLTGFQCVANPPPRIVGGLLHMIPAMDPEMMATEIAKSSPNKEHPTVFIDVGVNDGKAIRKMMAVEHLQIFGFEPNPGQLDKFIQEVDGNPALKKRVHLFPAGVGKAPGKLTLNYGKGDNAGSSFAYGHKTDVDANRYAQKEVDVVTLDEIVLPLVDPESMGE